MADVRVTDSEMNISVEGDILKVAGCEVETIDVYSIAGVHIASYINSNEVNIGQLSKGFYIVVAKDAKGNIASAKIAK